MTPTINLQITSFPSIYQYFVRNFEVFRSQSDFEIFRIVWFKNCICYTRFNIIINVQHTDV